MKKKIKKCLDALKIILIKRKKIDSGSILYLKKLQNFEKNIQILKYLNTSKIILIKRKKSLILKIVACNSNIKYVCITKNRPLTDKQILLCKNNYKCFY